MPWRTCRGQMRHNVKELVLSFNHMGPTDKTEVGIRLGAIPLPMKLSCWPNTFLFVCLFTYLCR